jgi:hypothetical protein
VWVSAQQLGMASPSVKAPSMLALLPLLVKEERAPVEYKRSANRPVSGRHTSTV